MSDTIPVTFSLAFFEYRANFADPVFELWSAPDRALQKSLYKALLPWGITLDNVQLPAQPKNVNEWQLTFNLLRFRTSVIIGTGGLIISVNNPDWSQANLIAAIAAAALAAVKEAITTSIAAQNASLAMHLTPMGSTAKQITAPFLNVKDAATSRLGEPKYLGFSIYGERAVWVVDALPKMRFA